MSWYAPGASPAEKNLGMARAQEASVHFLQKLARSKTGREKLQGGYFVNLPEEFRNSGSEVMIHTDKQLEILNRFGSGNRLRSTDL